MSFSYDYTVQFRDTDAAGVVYFASMLSICHVAYESSLIASGIDLKSFVSNPEFAVPIVHACADFMRPLFCGDLVNIALRPVHSGNDRFEIEYQISAISTKLTAHDQPPILATARTKHVSIDPTTRKRKDLPAELIEWIATWDYTLDY